MKIDQRVSVVAPTAGILLGFLDFVWIKFMPSLVAELGNSMAVWAVAAFLLTYFTGWTRGRAIAGAVIMLVLAVPAYDAAAALIQHDNWSNIWAPTSLVWMVLAVIAGVVFGGGGISSREPGPMRLAALGLPAAVLLAGVIMVVQRIGHPSYPTADLVEYAAVLTVLAILVTWWVARSRRDGAIALAYAIPLAAVGYLLVVAAVWTAGAVLMETTVSAG